jgi:hypothetical protein
MLTYPIRPRLPLLATGGGGYPRWSSTGVVCGRPRRSNRRSQEGECRRKRRERWKVLLGILCIIAGRSIRLTIVGVGRGVGRVHDCEGLIDRRGGNGESSDKQSLNR